MNNVSIVVTGIGVISSLGIGREVFWKQFLEGRTGIRPLKEISPLESPINFGGEVPGFKPKEYLSPMVYRKMGRVSRLSVAASIEAVSDAGLTIDEAGQDRIGVVVGTGYGNSGLTDDFFLSFMEGGAQGANPLLFADTVPNTAASHISLYHKLRGPLTTFCQNLISSELALAYACQVLDSGQAEAMLVGGADELSPILLHAFSVFKALNPSPNPILGKGIILGEGACILVLERAEKVLARGARIYGEIRNCVLNSGVTQPVQFEGQGNEMKKAVSRCLSPENEPEAVELIGLSANFSKDLDRLEYAVLKEVFGAKLSQIALSPLKYFSGEFAGMGTLRLAALLLAIRDQIIPPCVNPSELVPGKPWDRAFIPARSGPVTQALLTGFSFGGGNACLLVKKPTY